VASTVRVTGMRAYTTVDDHEPLKSVILGVGRSILLPWPLCRLRDPLRKLPLQQCKGPQGYRILPGRHGTMQTSRAWDRLFVHHAPLGLGANGDDSTAVVKGVSLVSAVVKRILVS